MRTKIIWYAAFTILLVVLSAGLYYEQFRLFHDTRDMLFYLLQDLAFVPIQVLLVTIVINGLFDVRERRSNLRKMNMVIGSFYSEIGVDLIRRFVAFDADSIPLRGEFCRDEPWTDRRFQSVDRFLRGYRSRIDTAAGDLAELRRFLHDKRPFILILLQNQNLLEHETFTDLLWAVLHLAEELGFREIAAPSEEDRTHLKRDIERAYAPLVIEWLVYLKHLRDEYPHIFSLMTRLNPLADWCEFVTT